MPDDVSASSAVVDSPAIPDLASLSSEDRQSWRQTGTFPTSTDATEDSSSSKPAEQAASTDASSTAASDTAQTEKPKGKGLATRHQQLDADITSLQEKLRQRAELRKQLDEPASAKADGKTGSSPQAQSLDDVVKSPDITTDPLSEDRFFARFPDAAYGQYQRYLTRYEVLSARQADAQQQHRSQVEQVRGERVRTFAERISTAVKTEPALRAKIDASPVSAFTPMEALPPGMRPGPENMLAQEVMTSEFAPQLLAHFADHPDDMAELLDKSPAEIIRAIGRLEAKVAPAVKPGPLPKTTSSAPPPPPSVTSRATVPADDLDGALAAGDFGRYKQLANARDVAARR